MEFYQGTDRNRPGDVAALEALRHLGEDGAGQRRPRRPARDRGQGGREAAARDDRRGGEVDGQGGSLIKTFLA